tara:strand:- start:1629 stop:1811 length:183 start_codon:yes stop_codon:yes gene_type:complete
MFEDDPRADDFDRYGTVHRVETQLLSRVGLASLFKSPDKQDYENFVRWMERDQKREMAHG